MRPPLALTCNQECSGNIPSITDYPGSSTSTAFSYNNNGNVNVEAHKDIDINYNVLNLPKELSWQGQNKYIKYFYTFNAQKVRATVKDNGTITKTDYCGPFVYETVSGNTFFKIHYNTRWKGC